MSLWPKSARLKQFFAVGAGWWLNQPMMEQAEVMAASGMPTTSPKRSLPEDVLASLEAVRTAQEHARRRARRETLHARLWVLVLVGAAGVGLAGFRTWEHRHARPQTATAVQSSPIAQPSVAPASEPVAAKAPLPATTGTSQEGTEPTPLAVPSANAHLEAAEGCDKAAIRSAPWRLSPEACTRAFEAEPNNASLALGVAQAAHARGRIAEAAQWAKKAVELDPNTAEAYVIIARAEAENGHHAQARRAYRSYLKLAPRGWHHAEARAALRASS